MLKETFLLLLRHGYVLDDPRLDNFILVDDKRIVIIDLERVEEEKGDDGEFFADSVIEMLMRWYK